MLRPLDATDVIDKRQRKKPVKKTRSASLPANAAKLLAALQTELTVKTFTKVNRTKLASEIGFPPGSIGASFINLKKRGYLEEDKHGHFRLTQTAQAK